MSLDFNFTAIKDWESLHDSSEELATSQGMVWTSMGIGMTQITEKNYIEWYTRALLYHGFYEEPIHTLAEVKRRIGLRTNVSQMTTHQFIMDIKRRMGLRMSDIAWSERAQERITKEQSNKLDEEGEDNDQS